MCLGILLFSCSVMSNSFQPHGVRHARLPCPLPSPGACSNSCPLMPSSHLTLCRPLLPSIFPSFRIFSCESVLRIRWPKYWSFSFNISPSSEHSGLTSFRVDCLILQSKGLLRVFSSTTVQKHQFFGT